MLTTHKQLLPVTALLLCTGHKAPPENPLSLQEKNKQLILLVNNLFNKKRGNEAIGYLADNLLETGTNTADGSFLAMMNDIQQTFPDARTRIISLSAESDGVIADCLFSGTHKGTATLPHHGSMLIGKTPTGRSFIVQHICMYRISHGKIVEWKTVRDDVGMYQQLGMLMSTASAA